MVRGFTLIELMVVMAIIAVLAAIAFPAYRDFAVRTQTMEATTVSSGLRQRLTHYYTAHNQWPADNSEAGVTQTISGTYTSSITSTDGLVSATFGNHASELITGKVLAYAPAMNDNGDVSWVCGYGRVADGMTAMGDAQAATTLAARYLPSTCRN